MLFSELAKRVAEKYPEVKTAYPMDCELSNVELYDPSGAVPPVDTLGIYTARQIGQDMTLPLCFVCAGTPDQAAHDKIAYSDSNYIISSSRRSRPWTWCITSCRSSATPSSSRSCIPT